MKQIYFPEIVGEYYQKYDFDSGEVVQGQRNEQHMDQQLYSSHKFCICKVTK